MKFDRKFCGSVFVRHGKLKRMRSCLRWSPAPHQRQRWRLCRMHLSWSSVGRSQKIISTNSIETLPLRVKKIACSILDVFLRKCVLRCSGPGDSLFGKAAAADVDDDDELRWELSSVYDAKFCGSIKTSFGRASRRICILIGFARSLAYPPGPDIDPPADRLWSELPA